MSFEIGARVETTAENQTVRGRVAFCGKTEFADGEWIGVVLDEARGKNDGTVKDVSYFTCNPNYGLFVRPSKVKLIEDNDRKPSTTLRAPASSLRKDSTTPRKGSPMTSPRMSPAASVEKISKLSSSRKPSSSRLSELTEAGSKTVSSVDQDERPREKNPPAETVVNRVKSIEELKPAAPILPEREGMDGQTEIELLRHENKDLIEKIETLRAKRKEDVQKLSEMDSLNVRLQSFQDVRTRLTDQNLGLMQEVQEVKKECKELRDWKDANQEDIARNAEQIEMALIDKEIAEERSEQLQKECDLLKEKIEELTTDLEILKEEMTVSSHSETNGAPTVNSVQLKQLEEKNRKLTEGLVKMRDLFGEEKHLRCDIEKQLEDKRSETIELMRIADSAVKASNEAEGRIKEYQEQIRDLKEWEEIEASMGSEELISALTMKNLDLEDQIRNLEQEKEEFESLRDMDEQIAEAQKLVERDLMKDIELQQIKINEVIQKLRQEEQHSDQLMTTIMKFREKTSALNEEIQEYKDQILRYEEQISGHTSEGQSMASKVSNLQVNASRAFAESVEKFISQLELEFSKRQVGYIKAFLPDNFTKAGGDNDCVLLNVLFPRLSSKANLLTKLVSDRFPSVPGGIRREHVTKAHKAEQWSHSARAAYLCSALIAVCGQFESSIQVMSVERLSRLSTLQQDMSSHEKSFDAFLDLLRQGRFDENTSLDNVEKSLAYFQNVFSVHVGGDDYNTVNWVSAVCRQLNSACTWAKIDADRIIFTMMPGVESSDVHSFVSLFMDELQKCSQLIIRASKRLPTEGSLMLSSQFMDDFQAVVSNIERSCSFLHETCNIASGQINISTESDGFTSERVKEMFHGVMDKFFGSTTLEKTFEPVEKTLRSIFIHLTNVVNMLESGAMEVPEAKDKKSFPPLLERAHMRKQAAAEAEGLRWQLEKKDVEIVDLKKTIKGKMDDISNYKLRLDMTEARMDNSGKQETAKIDHLESKIDQLTSDLKKQRIESDETLEKVQKECDEIKKENSDLRSSQTNMSKRALLQGIQSMESLAATSTSHAPTDTPNRAELGLLEMQLNQSQNALKDVTMEVLRLKAQSATIRDGICVPDLISGPETLKAHEKDSILESMFREAEHLRRDELQYRYFIANPTKSRRAQEDDKTKWLQEKEEFNNRVQSLRVRIHRYWARTYPGTEFPALFVKTPKAERVQSNISYGSSEFNSILSRWGVTAN